MLCVKPTQPKRNRSRDQGRVVCTQGITKSSFYSPNFMAGHFKQNQQTSLNPRGSRVPNSPSITTNTIVKQTNNFILVFGYLFKIIKQLYYFIGKFVRFCHNYLCQIYLTNRWFDAIMPKLGQGGLTDMKVCGIRGIWGQEGLEVWHYDRHLNKRSITHYPPLHSTSRTDHKNISKI